MKGSDLLGRDFSDLHVVLLAQVVLYVAGEDVARSAYAVLDHEPSERDDRNLRGASAYVDDHVALGRLDVETYSESRRHGLEYQEDVASSGMFGGVAHRPDLHFGRTGGDAHHHLEVGREQAAPSAAGLLDETAYHHFGGVEVGYDSVPRRPHGLESGVHFLLHQLGLLAQRDALAGIVVDRYDARFVQHYLVVLVDDGVGCSEVDRKFLV